MRDTVRLIVLLFLMMIIQYIYSTFPGNSDEFRRFFTRFLLTYVWGIIGVFYASNLDLFKKTFNIATVNVKNEYKQRLDDIKKQINNLLNNIASGIAVEETNNKINELEKEKETIEEKLIESDQKEKDNRVSLNMIKNLKSTWFEMDFDEQRRIIEHLIDRVIVNDNEINIYYNIY